MSESHAADVSSEAVAQAATEMEALRFLATRLRTPLNVAVGRVSTLAVPGDVKPPLELGEFRVETFGALFELGKRIVKRELMLDMPLAITLFLYLAEECGLTEPGDIPSKSMLKT